MTKEKVHTCPWSPVSKLFEMHSLLALGMALGVLIVFIILNTLSWLCSRSMEVEGESNRSALMQQIAELKREAALM